MVAKIPTPEGELALFKQIWEERAHFSQVTPDQEIYYDPWCFAHVLSKGASPKFKLLRENIVLMTPQQHDVFDNRTDQAKESELFEWVFELRELLKQFYYQNDSGIWLQIEVIHQEHKVE